jgi:hypothetical protein
MTKKRNIRHVPPFVGREAFCQDYSNNRTASLRRCYILNSDMLCFEG